MYNSLMELANSNEAFFYIDQVNPVDNQTYRVFSYRLASYTDFLQPYALESRGVMYRLEDSNPVLVCKPFAKFFNLNENPFVMDLDLSKVSQISDKRDGSLISTYMDSLGNLSVKSKQSISSSQVQDSLTLLNLPENATFKESLEEVTKAGYTVNLEYTSPLNRIILDYKTSELTVLGIRPLVGELTLREEQILRFSFPDIDARWVQDSFEDPAEVLLSRAGEITGVEGWVFRFEDGLRVKVKTDWYRSLHRAKESIDVPRRLFECIIDESIDDLKAMFSTDTLMIQRIQEMEQKVIPKYNHLVSLAEHFVRENKSLERKPFAIKGQEGLPEEIFGQVMQMYLDKPVDWKVWAKKNIKMFGIREEEVNESINN